MRIQPLPPARRPAPTVTLVHPRSSAPEDDRARSGVIRARAILLGLLLIPPVLYWLILNDMVRATSYVTKMSLFYNTLCVLFVVTLLNRGLARRLPRQALTQAELLAV